MQKLLNDLVNAFPGNKVTPENMVIYLENLGDLPKDALAQAVKNIILTGTWFPKISEIRTEAMKVWNSGGRYAGRDMFLERFLAVGADLMDLRERQIELQERDAEEGLYHADEWKGLLRHCEEKGYQTVGNGIRQRMVVA